MKRFKTRYIIAIVVCIGAIAWMISNLGSNLNYMENVSTAVHQREKSGASPDKVGGVVIPKSIDKKAQNGATFRLSDGKTTVNARVEDTPPAMFAECTAIVLTNTRWEGTTLVGTRIEVAHGSTYGSAKMKKNVVAALDSLGCPKPADK